MRAGFIPMAVAAVALSTAAAFAAETTTTGVVKAFDAKAMTLTLQDGTTYMLPKGFKDPGLKAGEKVSVAWQMANSRHEADTVTITK